MFSVYILQSTAFPERKYVGITTDVQRRLLEHNSGKSVHTNKFKPWKILTIIIFDDVSKAQSFEAYLKTHSGRAFSKKHF